ncbi:MAG: hypothetical protein WEC84_01025 [Candidatus Andersenbacteria bacterium]
MSQKPSNSEIITISLPKGLAQEVRSAMQQMGGSRSKLVQEALEQYLWLKEWQDLQEYGVGRSAELGLVSEDVTGLINEYRREKKQTSRRR